MEANARLRLAVKIELSGPGIECNTFRQVTTRCVSNTAVLRSAAVISAPIAAF